MLMISYTLSERKHNVLTEVETKVRSENVTTLNERLLNKPLRWVP